MPSHVSVAGVGYVGVAYLAECKRKVQEGYSMPQLSSEPASVQSPAG